MMCEICGEDEGRIKYTKVINGEKIEFYICEKCAKNKGFLSLISQPKTGYKKGEKGVVTPDTECSFCGWKLQDVEQKGRLGCPQCYTTFRQYIRTLAEELHGGEGHLGKAPILDKRKLGLKRKIREVKKALDDAIKREEYELAAELRDKIKNLSLKMVKDE